MSDLWERWVGPTGDVTVWSLTALSGRGQQVKAVLGEAGLVRLSTVSRRPGRKMTPLRAARAAELLLAIGYSEQDTIAVLRAGPAEYDALYAARLALDALGRL